MSGADEYSAPRDPLIGQIVQGRYKIAHAIGSGAMGVVYEAQHLLIGRKVALKAMAGHSVSPGGVQRFRREAQAAAAVGSSHVVDVLDMGQLDNGSFYIVMEHLDGVDLAFAVALEQRFSVARAIHVLGQLCDALSAVHAAGVVHRDLKPENIFLITRDGFADFVKVLDFGVCKFKGAEGARLTATGDAVGTPLFMAPEQVAADTDCDCRADIYALGALLYFVLTGHAPFDAKSLPALFMRICHEPAPRLAIADSHVSSQLDAIVQRALSKDPNARFSSCSAFKSALRAVQATPEEMARTLPSVGRTSRTTEYTWDNARDNGTVSIAGARRTHRSRWLGFVAVVVGVAALGASASSGAYLVRERGVEPLAPPGSTHELPRVAAAPPPVGPPSAEPTVAVAVSSQPVEHEPAKPPPTHGKAPAVPTVVSVLKLPEPDPVPAPVPLTTASAPPAAPPATAPSSSASPLASGVHLNREPKRGL